MITFSWLQNQNLFLSISHISYSTTITFSWLHNPQTQPPSPHKPYPITATSTASSLAPYPETTTTLSPSTITTATSSSYPITTSPATSSYPIISTHGCITTTCSSTTTTTTTTATTWLVASLAHHLDLLQALGNTVGTRPTTDDWRVSRASGASLPQHVTRHGVWQGAASTHVNRRRQQHEKKRKIRRRMPWTLHTINTVDRNVVGQERCLLIATSSAGAPPISFYVPISIALEQLRCRDGLTLSLRAEATSLGEIISQSPSLGDDGGPIPGPSLII
ncbi:unnamed protein product [Arctogadus glacialis]